MKVEETLEPLGHRVLVEAELPEEYANLGFKLDEEGNMISSSGLMIQSHAAARELDALSIGRVVSVGELAFKDLGGIERHTSDGNLKIVEAIGKPWCKVGDLVYYSKHTGRRLKDPHNPTRVLFLIIDKEVQVRIKEV